MSRTATRRAFRPSVWTFVAPVALAACVLVLFAIARDAGWTTRHHTSHPARTTGSAATGTGTTGGAILVRPHRGETLVQVGVRYGIDFDRLKALNPTLPVAGPLSPTRRVRLR